VQFLTNSQVAVLPLFLMMGSLAVVAGMSGDIYELAHTLLAHRRGGLALATIGGCAGFGALTGSSLATVATIGRVALPEMSARGYATSLSTGSVAAGGTLGALVPPSIPLIFYALLTEQSIGRLFVAAVIPAVIAVLSTWRRSRSRSGSCRARRRPGRSAPTRRRSCAPSGAPGRRSCCSRSSSAASTPASAPRPRRPRSAPAALSCSRSRAAGSRAPPCCR
jgi:TRAP-type uncharacterized transport system fused permease subunit